LRNGFNANGDQTGKGYSSYTYRPFTLEANFAAAAGLQEMLIQSHTGTVEVFPAIPERWKDVVFHNLRAEGAFLISAERKGGEVVILEGNRRARWHVAHPFAEERGSGGNRHDCGANSGRGGEKPDTLFWSGGGSERPTGPTRSSSIPVWSKYSTEGFGL
jgi:hypothetical protein